jgi:hypothetical protein
LAGDPFNWSRQGQNIGKNQSPKESKSLRGEIF